MKTISINVNKNKQNLQLWELEKAHKQAKKQAVNFRKQRKERKQLWLD